MTYKLLSQFFRKTPKAELVGVLGIVYEYLSQKEDIKTRMDGVMVFHCHPRQGKSTSE